MSHGPFARDGDDDEALPPWEGGDLVVTGRVRVPRDELRFKAVRSRGPGGQNVNRVATKVELRYHVASSRAFGSEVERQRVAQKLGSHIVASGDVVIASDVHREQGRNKEECVRRLVRLLRDAIKRPRPRLPTKPTPGARARRLQEKRARGERKAGRRPPPRGGDDA